MAGGVVPVRDGQTGGHCRVQQQPNQRGCQGDAHQGVIEEQQTLARIWPQPGIDLALIWSRFSPDLSSQVKSTLFIL